jgi:hypothetical protein
MYRALNISKSATAVFSFFLALAAAKSIVIVVVFMFDGFIYLQIYLQQHFIPIYITFSVNISYINKIAGNNS